MMTIGTNHNLADESESADGNQNKFLSFSLGNEEYGVEILKVREIIGVLDITPLPQTPDYVKGVINLRGKIIPVIELRRKFNMPSVEYTEETCIIVVEVQNPQNDDHFQMGVIVDSVSEVRNITRSQIEPAPDFGNAMSTNNIMGMGKVKVGESTLVLILLDIDKVVSLEGFSDLGTRPGGAVDSTETHPGSTLPKAA